MPKTKFKVGDKVKISKDSEYYGVDATYNPADKVGTVIEVQKADYSSRLKVKVLWDKESNISNTYAHEDLVYAAVQTTKVQNDDEFTVDKEFVMEAYKSACSTWKAKIEAKFPELFPSPYAKIVKDESKIALSSLFYMDSDDRYQPLEHNIALIDGIAGHGRDVPEEARFRGIYVNDRHGELNLELVETKDGYCILFKKKQ